MMEQVGNNVGNVCGVYRLDFSNGVYYIGQSVNIKRRYTQHIKELKKGTHSNPRMQNCFSKYGVPNCSILLECNKEDLSKNETSIIINNIDNPLCCNICKEGMSRLGIKCSDDTKSKISYYQRLKGKAKSVDMFNSEYEYLGSFETITDAAKYTGGGPKDIQKSCKSMGYYKVKNKRFLFSIVRNKLLESINNAVPF